MLQNTGERKSKKAGGEDASSPKRCKVAEDLQLLCEEAEKGRDISDYVPALRRRMKNKGWYVALLATKALIHHYLNQKDEKKIEELFLNNNSNSKTYILVALEEAIKLGKDIDAAVPTLIRALNDDDWRIREMAAKLLVIHFFKKEEKKKKIEELFFSDESLMKALNDDDWRIRKRATRVLKKKIEELFRD
jgi:HEAT repeat protein